LKRMLVLVFSLILIHGVCATMEWKDGDAKSTKDPLFLEMDSSSHYMMPSNVKVYINDPLIKGEAQYAEISTSIYAYSTDGTKIYDASGGVFRQTIEYDGQDTISFAFRPNNYPEQTSSVSVVFYKVKPMGTEYPNTSPGSEYEGYNCNREDNKLLCGDNEGCNICSFTIGSVRREFAISESVGSIATPGRFAFTDNKESLRVNKFASDFQSFSHRSEMTVINNLGLPYVASVSYDLRMDVHPAFKDLTEVKESQMNFARQSYTIVQETSPPGGMTGGFAFEGIKFTPPKDMGEKANYEWADIKYKVMSELYPKGSGHMIVEASRYGPVGKGQAAAERDAVISEVRAFAASLSLARGSIYTPDKVLTHKYSVRGKPDEIVETAEHIAHGTITNYFGNPMPYMNVRAQIKGTDYIGYTDEGGVYKIPLAGLEVKEGEEIDFKVFLAMEYRRNGKDYFSVNHRINGNTHAVVQGVKDAKLTYGEHPEVNFKLDGEGDTRTNFAQKEMMKHYSVIFYHTHEAVDFVLDVLKEDMDYKLPLDIMVGNPDKKTLYSPEGYILISADDASLSDSDRPMNREYHEFMHALMYDIYNAWPEGRSLPGTKNHDGFLNPSTADSYMEGFAEFMAMVIADENGDYTPYIYAGFGSMENNYRPWDANGFYEELAVASLLWDMYDDRNEKGDSLTLPLEDLWKVLKVKRKDFYEYYTAFKTEFPQKADEIDDLFKEHGFFHDTRAGDGNYTPGEPWKYINEAAGTYRFIDMSDNVTKISYQPGFTIGKATNYNRSTRSSAVMVPDSFLKVEDDEVDFYTIKVEFPDSSRNYEYDVDRKGGLIYISPLPYSEDARIIVSPASRDYAAQRPYEIQSKSLNALLNPQNSFGGYFAAHEFELKPTGIKEDQRYELFGDTKPSYSYEGDLGEEYDVRIDEDYDGFGGAASGFPFLTLLLIGGAGAFGFMYFKSSKLRKTTADVLDKAKAAIAKAARWFIRYGVPLIRKGLIWAWGMAVRISKAIFHHSKNAYHNAKPHLKKTHEHIKRKIGDLKGRKAKVGEAKENA
jgi:hypothetical protein